ncbi:MULTISPECIES: glycosyltransferase family 39 protein [unclassified Oceanispirochaeta]|uniref:ArnT family glycosyltransferase n=1 Tax=unclassified Oceanispirochaeta TaxID=2635722 RepID=UPI0011C02F6D|nr:glycosyltransferase family 39 protein [Oceanispirochaeta sp. M1]MBF9015998.1 glycosyltransferase family 39 protein [Oceanispirochaeta sp. M2]NPD72461.1 4-amino-4-deoxy-L-arabinose transferase [Oceanispirochaeta sp. M1]
MKLKIRKNHFILIYLSLWLFINLFFLTDYPFVHSDEPWLSGLSRSMIENSSLSSTEDFFDLYERNPHAIKLLFHLIQIPVIKTLGYSILSVRLISLLTGFLSLFLFYNLILKLYRFDNKHWVALFTTIWLSIDIQFVYISHLARQEIILIFILLSMLNLLSTENMPILKRGALTGLMAGLAVGFHPNSFIIAWPIGLFLILEIIRGKRKWTEGLSFLLAAGMIAALFIALSFHFNPDFIRDYSTYGEPLGVLDSPDMKIIKLPGFYSKLFHQISGTYHTPNIKMQMILFPLLLIISFLKKDKRIGNYSLIGFIGFNIGLLIIGKYSQPSISFLLPFYYLSASVLIHFLISGKKKRFLRALLIILLTATLFFTITEINKEKENYKDYLSQIQNKIPQDSVVLGGLYMDFAIPDGQFYDWRNLYFLKENNLSLEEYIEKREIQYIVVPEELSFIYKNRPYWNVLYGNIAHWYPQLIEFTENECSLLEEINSSAYGIRIAAYRYSKPWYVRIYKVDGTE